jgi:hypothetical protein
MIQNKLIKQAVKKLKRFGFTNVTEENITIDDVYKLYFRKILLLNLGENKETDKVIHEMLDNIKGLMESNKLVKFGFAR